VRFAAADDFERVAALIDDNTRALFCESIGNPAGNVVDIARWAEIAHAAGVPLIVDNTVATPFLCRVFDHGADIAIHSLTKYIGGHGTTIGGAIVDSGKFDWAAQPERFAVMNTPDPSYHGVVYTEALGPAAFIGRCRVVPLRNTGAALAPHSAFLIMQGLETLGLRMERHCENAEAVAAYLQGTRGDAGELRDAGGQSLPRDLRAHLRRARLGHSELRARGRSRGRRALHRRPADDPAPGEHRRCQVPGLPPGDHHAPPAQSRGAGLGGRQRGMVRLSIGIEHVDDIIADLEQALAA
jgi:O-acetylhomoserine (thiol)-lyase